MMKLTSTLLLVFALFTLGCTSSKEYLARSQYDAAIQKSAKKLKKNPSKTAHIAIIKEAYSKANQVNNERILFLRKKGDPANWSEVVTNYTQLKQRQEIVKSLPSGVINQLGISWIDYDKELIAAQQKAAEFHYARALKLLENSDRFSARDAYEDLLLVKSYYSTYRDVDAKINEALAKGRTHVLFEMKNTSRTILPADFEKELLKISLSDLNARWINYDTYKNSQITYDFSIRLNIKHIAISPESIRESEKYYEQQIEDGYTYEYDRRGNVKKDSLGNDIKIKVVKIVSCKVIETVQNKKALLEGTLDYYNNHTGQLIKTEPISTETIFDHHAATAHGDYRALPVDIQKQTKVKPMPFPTDASMLMDAAVRMKEITKNIIYNNKQVVN